MNNWTGKNCAPGWEYVKTIELGEAEQVQDAMDKQYTLGMSYPDSSGDNLLCDVYRRLPQKEEK